MDGQVVEEQREVTAPELLGELADEGDEDLSVDCFRMYCIINESSILTYCSNECKSLYLQI